jgi:hypothetical protein
MPTPPPDELDRLHNEIAALMEQASGMFDAVGLTDEEKTFAKDASEKVGHFAIRLYTDLRHLKPRPRIRMVAVSAAVASALAVVDANARASDAFNPK